MNRSLQCVLAVVIGWCAGSVTRINHSQGEIIEVLERIERRLPPIEIRTQTTGIRSTITSGEINRFKNLVEPTR